MGHPGLFGSAAAADMVPGAQGRCGDRGPVIADASRSLQSEHPCLTGKCSGPLSASYGPSHPPVGQASEQRRCSTGVRWARQGLNL
jgi:hypothetical protein